MSYSTQLYHHGIKGQKWGVRRFQNADGSRTAAGKKREILSSRNLNGAKKTLNESREITRRAKDINDRAIKRQKQKALRKDLSNMSDKELREKINRELLERQYNDMFNNTGVSKGRERAAEILDTAGDIVSIGASAVAIMVALRTMRR